MLSNIEVAFLAVTPGLLHLAEGYILIYRSNMTYETLYHKKDTGTKHGSDGALGYLLLLILLLREGNAFLHAHTRKDGTTVTSTTFRKKF